MSVQKEGMLVSINCISRRLP